jgi:hypothetical protein
LFNTIMDEIIKKMKTRRKRGCQNKIDTFLQFFHSLKLSYEI